MSIRKTMYVKENSFRKLDDPFNDVAKKYVFYVKICDVGYSHGNKSTRSETYIWCCASN